MAFVRVEQRNARLAAPVRLETVQGKDGPLAKGTLVAISNVRKRVDQREQEATSIQWTLWGKLADNAAEYLTTGSRVNVVGRVQNNNYTNADGQPVYAMTFTCEELDYLDSRQEADARRTSETTDPTVTPRAQPMPQRSRTSKRSAAGHGADEKDDAPF